MAKTLTQLSSELGRSCYDHIAAEFGAVDIPVHGLPQSQGDVRIRPLADTPAVTVMANGEWTPVCPAGVVVVKGMHDHVLTGPEARWTTDVTDETSLAVGVVDAPQGAYLWHAEHGATGIAPGAYVIRRQREQAEEQRLVAD